MEAVILLEKYSDWLEAYSFLSEYKPTKIKVFFIDNDRNDVRSTFGVFDLHYSGSILYFFDHNQEKVFGEFRKYIFEEEVETVLAPFIRYRHLWRDINELRRKNITTIHLSETIPDSFGLIGYRIGFRGKKVSSWLTWPYFYLFAQRNKPNSCYFPLAKWQINSFVQQTKEVVIPSLSAKKRSFLDEMTKGKKRVLLLGGFGYDIVNMAKYLCLDEFIATSKGKEIIVDGISHPVDERICAEEVLLSGLVCKVVGYESTVMVWAKLIDESIEIECFTSQALANNYGFFYNWLAKKTLGRLGINVQAECKDMLQK